MDELAFADATTLAGRIKAREISSTKLLEHYISRMEKYNPEINAIICTQLDKARDRARQADEALAAGEDWGPLHGVPMTVKESFNLKGLPTTWGDPQLRDNIADHDAVACMRLQAAGAVIFGKTNVPINLADMQSFNDVYGTTNNPHDLERGPGGSSGGAAAAIAAGLSGLEMGSDIGGSIRNPAHYCGVFGHKATWGVLPLRGHAKPGVLTPSDISVIGPLARSAEDLRLVMEIVGGADDIHLPGWKLELPRPTQKSLGEYKIAVWADDACAAVDQSVIERVLMAAKLVEDAGGEVDFTARPEFDATDSHLQYTNLLHSAMAARQPDEVFEKQRLQRESLADGDDSALAQVLTASTLYYRDWHRHNENRTHLRWAWHRFFQEFDLLLTPMCVTSAFAHDQNPNMGGRAQIVNNERRPYFEQIFWAGLTGVSYLPSTVVPTGLDNQGLPIGVQIVGREMGDLFTIDFARQVDAEIGGFVPAVAYRD